MRITKGTREFVFVLCGLPLCLLYLPDLLRPLYQSSDGAAAVREAPVGAVGMDPIAFVFGFFQRRGEDNAAAGGVGFHGVGERGGVGQTEDGLEHLDHIFERVVIVIQNDDVIQLAQIVFCRPVDIRV